MSQFVDCNMICQINYGYVYPHILYGIEPYGSTSRTLCKRIQIMQNKLLKALTGKNNRYSIQEIHRELKLLNVENIHKLNCLVFVYTEQFVT